jgi:hypothetical protein
MLIMVHDKNTGFFSIWYDEVNSRGVHKVTTVPSPSMQFKDYDTNVANLLTTGTFK